MKRMRKELMALVGAASMAAGIMGSGLTAFADTQGMTVTADVTSTYSVQIPAALTLTAEGAEPNTFSGSYTVGARGYILDSQYVEISPADEFYMVADHVAEEGMATVTQDVTRWTNSAAGRGNEYMMIGKDTVATTEGSVSVVLKAPGSYTGTLTFAYGLKNLPLGD